MRKSILLLAFILICAPFIMAQSSVTVQWDYGTPMPSGFEARTTLASGAVIVTDCGAATSKTCTIPAIPNSASYSIAVYAYNLGVPTTIKLYSDPSNAVPFTLPAKPAVPTNNRILSYVIAGIGAIGIIILWLFSRNKQGGKI